MTKKRKIIFTISFITFVIIAISVSLGLTQNIDQEIYMLVKNMHNQKLTQVLKIITNLGGIPSLSIIMFILVITLIICKKEKLGIAIMLNLLISSLSYIILKNIFQRSRPEMVQSLISEVGYSFPSGHSCNNMAFYGLIIYLVCENVKNKKLRNLLCIGLGIIPILIGFSRIYLGVHYFTDVIAGFCLGIMCIILFTTCIFNKISI